MPPRQRDVTPHLSIVNVNGTLVEALQYPAGAVLGPSSGKFRNLIIFFPGNPGCIEFYREFLEACFMSSSTATAWLGVSFAGHSYRELMGTRCYSLEDQVAHLTGFVDMVHAAQPDANVTFAGHSIGAWLALRVLEYAQGCGIHVIQTLLLFPTLTNLAVSDKGKTMKYIMKPGIRHLVALAAEFLGLLLPLALRRFLLLLCSSHETTKATDYYRVAPHFLKYELVLNALFLAHHEMQEVKVLPSAMKTIVLENSKKIVFYYAAYDHWVPKGVPEEMKERFPAATHCLDQNGAPHAFCITHSQHIARIVNSLLGPSLSAGSGA